MRFYLTNEQEALKREFTDFFEQEMPVEWMGKLWDEESNEEHLALGRVFDKKLMDRGYYVMHWPKEYGGQGRSIIEQAIFNELLAYYAPPSVGDRARNVVGPALMVIGSEEQKQRFLPLIARGEACFCLGWTEPNAGSDLSMIQTTARQEGDEYVINGSKMFTSIGHYATHVFMSVITDTTVPKRQGASLFIVDMHSPGISLSPIRCLDGRRTNMTYFDDVRVPATNLVGEKNRGFQQLAMAANFERGNLAGAAACKRALDEFIEFIKHNKVRGRDLTKDPEIRRKIADIATEVEAWRLIGWRVVWLQSQGQVPQAEASLVQLLRKKVTPKLFKLLWELGGPLSLLTEDSRLAPLSGKLEYYARHAFNIHGQGGLNQTRNAIAHRGLGMPRYRE